MKEYITVTKLILVKSCINLLIIKFNHFSNIIMPENANLATILDFGSHFGFIFEAVTLQN